MDIFDPKIEALRKAADKTLFEILMSPIQDKADAATVLAAIYACGTYERPIRRALLHLIRFCGTF